MKKLVIVIGVLFLFCGMSVFAAESELDKTVKQFPTEVVFPYISVPSGINATSAYDLLLDEINTNKIGNFVSPSLITQVKGLVAEATKSSQDEYITMNCAKRTKGYFLRVVLNIAPYQTDRGTFELIDPTSLKTICKIEATDKTLIATSYEGVAKRLIKNGVKDLATEIAKLQPSLLKR